MTKNYIKMCEKNEDLQREWKPKEGDRYVYKNDPEAGIVIWFEENDYLYCEDMIYLPTQEQLQEMVKTVLEVDDFGLVEEFYNFIYGEESQPNQIDSPIKSMEQFWLAFVMHELYNKLWTDKKWVKAK